MLHLDSGRKDFKHVVDRAGLHDNEEWEQSSRTAPSTAGSVVSDTINSTDADVYSYREEWDLVGDSLSIQPEAALAMNENDTHNNNNSSIESATSVDTKCSEDLSPDMTLPFASEDKRDCGLFEPQLQPHELTSRSQSLAECSGDDAILDSTCADPSTPENSLSESPIEGTSAYEDGETRRIQVLVRVRPACGLTDDKTVVTVCNQGTTIQVQSSNSHNGTTGMLTVTECAFDRVFSTSATQEEIFSAIEPSVRAAIGGFNSTVFAYGQTGTGKTHTLFGKDYDLFGATTSTNDSKSFEESVPSHEVFGDAYTMTTGWGIVPRALCLLLSHAARVSAEETRILLQCSFVQIYNDRLFDLLTDRRRQKPLLLREQPRADGLTNVIIQGLSSERIESVAQAMQLLRQGLENRSVRETDANLASSRSHAIVQVNITLQRRLPTGEQSVRTSRLNLVDLAGSEKWNTELPMDEAHSLELKNINASLSALGNCIAALAEPGRKHIPYRDSTLTRVLQDSLGGNTQSCLIATVSPSLNASDETTRTLQFADRARSVMQTVRVNDASGGLGTELLAARAQISKLRDRLESAQRRHHEARLKELDECQRRFAETLKVKDREIYKLSRDNAAFLRWKEEDSRRIKELEARVRELESSSNALQQVRSQDFIHANDPIRASKAVELQEAFGHDNEESVKTARPGKSSTLPSNLEPDSHAGKPDRVRRSDSTHGISRSSSKTNLPRLGAEKNSEYRTGNQGSKTYKQLLERYALAQGRVKRDRSVGQQESLSTDDAPTEDPSSQWFSSPAATATMIPRFSSIAPRMTTPPLPSPSTSSMVHSPGFVSARHSTSSLPLSPETVDAIHPIYYNNKSLLKSSSHTADLEMAGMSTAQSPMVSRSTSTIPSVNVSGPSQYLSAKAPGVEAWTPQEERWDQNSGSLIPSAKPSAVQCAKHSLRGCVLCNGVLDAEVPARSLPTVVIASQDMSFSSASERATVSTSQGEPCARHRLSRCFICCKTSTSDSPYMPLPSQFPVNAVRVDKPVDHHGFGMTNATSGAVLPKCTAHSLSNCILCSKVSSGAVQVERRASMSSVESDVGMRNYLVDMRSTRMFSSSLMASGANSLSTSFAAVSRSTQPIGLDGGYAAWSQANV